MKKKVLALFLMAAIILGTMAPVFAKEAFPFSGNVDCAEDSLNLSAEMCALSIENYYGKISQSKPEIQLIAETIPDCNFGGMYSGEDGLLIVNIVDDIPLNLYEFVSEQKIEFHQVEYSLSFLENLADALCPYMSEYGIVVLDANDATNKLDICLKDFSRENILAIETFVLSLSSSTSMLNFIDYSNGDISFKGQKITDTYLNSIAKTVESPSPQASMIVAPGYALIIGDYSYTLGPFRDSRTFYSAGHYVSESSSVYVPSISVGTVTLPSFYIGSVTKAVFSGNCDASVISLSTYQASSDFSYTFTTPNVNDSIMLNGATSGRTIGTVTRINARVYYENEGVTLTGMGAGTYTSQPGDSGGPLFSNVDATTPQEIQYCYGVQSGSHFVNDVATESYFTLPKNLPDIGSY